LRAGATQGRGPVGEHGGVGEGVLPGLAIAGTLDPVTQDAQVHPMVGDVDAARSLFIPAQADLLEPDVLSEELNGFRPPESLMALPIGAGEIVVARQWGEFAAVRVSLECP